MKIEQEAF